VVERYFFEPVESGVLGVFHGQKLNSFSSPDLNQIVADCKASILDYVNLRKNVACLLSESDLLYLKRPSHHLFKISTCGDTDSSRSIERLCKNYDNGCILLYTGNKIEKPPLCSFERFKSYFDNRFEVSEMNIDFGTVFFAKSGEFKFKDDYVAFNLKDCNYDNIKRLETSERHSLIPRFSDVFKDHVFSFNGYINGYTAVFMLKDRGGSVAVHTTPELNFVSLNSLNGNLDMLYRFIDYFNPGKVESLHIGKKNIKNNLSLIY